MKELLKFIGPSFFSDKIARRAPARGVGSILLAAFLAVVILLLGLIGAYALPFNANFNNTPELVSTVERAFGEGGAALEIKDGVLHSDRIIDTVASAEDRQAYSAGYDVVVDTRAADTFDDFYAYCTTESGKEIPYEEYLEKDEDVKTLYRFAVRYSGTERVIDEEWIEKCESYLDGAADEETASAYAEVKKKTGDEYSAALYNLYVRAYYPSLTAYESDGNAPRTRNYYYYNYADRDKILYVFNDSMIGVYATNTGAKNTFYGIYTKLGDGKIGTSAAAVNDFISTCYSGATAITVYSAVMGFVSVAPFMVLVVLAVIFLLFCLTKLLKLDELRFGGAAKTVCSFITVAAVFAAIAIFALGFVASQSLLSWLEAIVLFAVLAIRVAVMLIISAAENRRKAQDNGETAAEVNAAQATEEVAQ